MHTKNVLITGASRGIGAAAADIFASQGWHIIITSSASIPELEALKARIELEHAVPCTAFTGDMGSETDTAALFDLIAKTCGGLDVLVNNAGISHTGLITDLSLAEWNHIITTNLTSAFLCSKLALPYMIYRKSGKIINISSVWGICGASCEVAYSASKGGLNSFTKALAKELAPSNIQVNAIACGAIDTAMNQHLAPEERLALETEIPTGRFGTPKEAAELIYQLASSNAYLTGQILSLDGGWI